MIGPWRRVVELEADRVVLLSQLAAAEGRAAQAHLTVLDLTAKIVDMRREGFQSPPPVQSMGPREPSIPDAVLAAMEDRAAPGSPGWDRLSTFARKKLREDVDPDEVAKAVLEGAGDFSWR